MASEKFHFKQGDILYVDDTNRGEGQYGEWQWIKVKEPSGKTNSQIFLAELVDNLRAGDRVRVEEIDVYPRRAEVKNTRGELKWTTIFKVDIKVSLVEDGGFGPGFTEVNAPEAELPF